MTPHTSRSAEAFNLARETLFKKQRTYSPQEGPSTSDLTKFLFSNSQEQQSDPQALNSNRFRPISTPPSGRASPTPAPPPSLANSRDPSSLPRASSSGTATPQNVEGGSPATSSATATPESVASKLSEDKIELKPEQKTPDEVKPLPRRITVKKVAAAAAISAAAVVAISAALPTICATSALSGSAVCAASMPYATSVNAAVGSAVAAVVAFESQVREAYYNMREYGSLQAPPPPPPPPPPEPTYKERAYWENLTGMSLETLAAVGTYLSISAAVTYYAHRMGLINRKIKKN